MTSSTEKEAFLNDFMSDIVNLGKHFMDAYKFVNGSKNASRNELFVDLQTVISNIEIQSGEIETKSEFKIFNQQSQQNSYQWQSQNGQNQTELQVKNRLSRFKRVDCSICGKKNIVECFLERHIKRHNEFEIYENNIEQQTKHLNKFEIDNSIDLNQKPDLSLKLNSDILSKWTKEKPFKKPWKYRFGNYGRVKCTICSKMILECFFPKHLRMHNRITKEKSINLKIRCHLCDKMFNKIHLGRHMNVCHGKTSQHSLTERNISCEFMLCNVCGKSVNVYEMKRHMWGVHRISMEIGQICENAEINSLPTENKFQNEKIVICFICKRQKTSRTIENHFRKRHCQINSVQNFEPKPGVIGKQSSALNNSGLCDFQQHSSSTWLTHERCYLCHEFITKVQFNNHMKLIHKGVGFRYKCSICEAGFMRLRGCKVHIGHIHKNKGGKALAIKPIKPELD